MLPRHRVALIAVAATILAALGLATPSNATARTGRVAAKASSCPRTHWIASWASAPSDSVTLGDPSLEPALAVGDQSFRMMVTPHRGGSTIRVHLTNRFGNGPVTFKHVTVGLQASGAALKPGSVRTVTFNGKNAVTVPAGRDVISDPVALTITAFQPVAISYFVPGVAWPPTEHFNANQTSYFTNPLAGDRSASTSATGFSHKITSWYWVDGLDVRAPGSASTVVAFGDSITDGFVTGSPALVPESSVQIDKNVRYPDFLQRRLTAAHLPLATVDAGISGNRVLQPGIIPMMGPSGVSRIDDDATDVTGVTNVIIMEGINDLGQPPWPTAAQLEHGYVRLIDALHARHIHVLLGTLMPSGSALLDGPSTAPDLEATRAKVNAWIRSQHQSDGVVDFDKAMRDPSDPQALNPAYADGDFLHPSPAGYRAMAAAVPLHKLVSGCSATTAITGKAGSPQAPAGFSTTASQLLASITALTMTKDNGYDATTLATVVKALFQLGILGV